MVCHHVWEILHTIAHVLAPLDHTVYYRDAILPSSPIFRLLGKVAHCTLQIQSADQENYSFFQNLLVWGLCNSLFLLQEKKL